MKSSPFSRSSRSRRSVARDCSWIPRISKRFRFVAEGNHQTTFLQVGAFSSVFLFPSSKFEAQPKFATWVDPSLGRTLGASEFLMNRRGILTGLLLGLGCGSLACSDDRPGVKEVGDPSKIKDASGDLPKMPKSVLKKLKKKVSSKASPGGLEAN